jgi:hypothetical protein
MLGTMPEPPAGEWGTCATCGDAMPPGAKACPTCGKEVPAAPLNDGSKPRSFTRRLKMHRTLRIVLVSAVAVGLAGVLILALFQGPPVAADPLTGNWSFTIQPGTFQEFYGAITGGDYLSGNFTVMTPPGAVVTFVVYNSSNFPVFNAGRPTAPAYANPPVNNGLVDFSPLVTDSYYFVWENHYPVASHIVIKVYVSTEYMSNVVVE